MSASLLSLGFVLGMRHAMESDHVAAVASLATRSLSRIETVRLAAAWGAGHTLTLLLFFSLFMLLDLTMPERLAQGLELAVGLLLVGLGVDVLRRLWCESGDCRSGHGQLAMPGHGNDHHHGRFPLRALLVGMMHGMAGSAALILLTLESAQSAQTAMVYVLLFGMGSIAGMVTLSAIIAVPLVYSSGRAWPGLAGRRWLQSRMRSAIGGATVCLGGWMIYDIGITGGLLV